MRTRLVLMASAAGLAALAATPGYAQMFTYSGYNVVNQQNVTITDSALGVNGLQGGSGQIDLYGSGANVGQTLDTWCIDIQHDLQGSGTYTFGYATPVTLTAAQASEIGGLIAFGDNNLYKSVDGQSASDTSAAVQQAIWTIEYGSGLTISGQNNPTLVNYLITSAQSGAIPGNGFDPILEAGNQTLAVVPEASTWAMMALGFAGLGFAGFRKAKAKAAFA